MNKINEAINNTTYIDVLMKQQANNFYVERDETGDLVYHWADARVDMLSSSKLWSILLRCDTSDQSLAFTDAITNELISRKDFDHSPRLWMQ
ncbi:MAG: hypothetical protein COA46_05125 [Porticoccaceae bacterium]|nr:MAG: hypothetical protein COA46_05125 [Porticoccaceae bacterium]